MSTYKPLSDEELCNPELVALAGVRYGKTLIVRLVEQARRANQLTAVIKRYQECGWRDVEMILDGTKFNEALAAYHGEETT